MKTSKVVSVLVILAVIFTAGIGMGLALPVPLWAVVLVSLGICLAVLRSVLTGRHTTITFIISVFLLGWMRPLDDDNCIPSHSEPPCSRVLQGLVSSPPTRLEKNWRLSMDLEQMSACSKGPGNGDLKPAGGTLMVTVMGGNQVPCKRGDRIRFRAAPKAVTPRNNRGRRVRGFHRSLLTAIVENPNAIARVQVGATDIGHGFDLLRNHLALFWQKTIGPGEARLARALTLGESQVLDASQRERFRRTGTAHLLSVSGLHLGLAVFFSLWLLNRLFVRIGPLARRMDVGRVAAACAMGVAITFTLLAGCRTPVVRACVMAVSALAARSLGRNGGTVEALALAGAALLAVAPASLLTPGFQLSFVAVMSFVLVLNRDYKHGGLALEEDVSTDSRIARLRAYFQKAALGLLKSSLAASAATTPIVLFHFDYISWIAFGANLLVVPITGFVIIPGLLLTTALAVPLPSLAALLAKLVGPLLGLLEGMLGLISKAPCTIESPGPLVSAAIAASSFCALAFLGGKRKISAVLLSIALLFGLLAPSCEPSNFAPGQLTVDFLDVGQGDSALLTYPNGEHWLVDAGGSTSDTFDVGELVVVPLLRSLGVKRLTKMVLSHPDIDHVGGMPAVLDAIEVDEVWDNGQGEAEGANDAYTALLKKARMEGISIRRTPGLCGTHQVGAVLVKVVHPCFGGGSYEPALSFNDNSIVLIIEYGLTKLSLAGDIQREAEQILVERGAIPNLDVLKLSHHGSNTSSSNAFLEAASPWTAVASLGLFNRHAIPHRQVLRRLNSRKIRLFRTDHDGAVRVVTNGRLIGIEGTSPSRAR